MNRKIDFDEFKLIMEGKKEEFIKLDGFIKSIVLEKCTINNSGVDIVGSIEGEKVRTEFNECIFNHPAHERINKNEVISFKKCTFKKGLRIKGEGSIFIEETKINNPIREVELEGMLIDIENTTIEPRQHLTNIIGAIVSIRGGFLNNTYYEYNGNAAGIGLSLKIESSDILSINIKNQKIYGIYITSAIANKLVLQNIQITDGGNIAGIKSKNIIINSIKNQGILNIHNIIDEKSQIDLTSNMFGRTYFRNNDLGKAERIVIDANDRENSIFLNTKIPNNILDGSKRNNSQNSYDTFNQLYTIALRQNNRDNTVHYYQATQESLLKTKK